jgi:hypothetical protein
MLCEQLTFRLKSGRAGFGALVRHVERVEFETPEITIYLFECFACGGQVHSHEVSVPDIAIIEELLVAQTSIDVRSALKNAA